MASPPPLPLCVLTDVHLFERIVSFQNGVPYPLYTFWVAHKPSYDYFLRGFQMSEGVIERIVEGGTLELLKRAKQVRLRQGERCYELSLDRVVPLAVEHNRPDMLEWGLENMTYAAPLEEPDSKRRRRRRENPVVGLWRAAFARFRDDDTCVLDLLKRHVPIGAEDVEKLFSSDFTARVVKSMELAHWLLAQLPEAKIERHIMDVAAYRRNVDMARFFYERGTYERCNSAYFSTLYDTRDLEMLTFLVEHDLIDVCRYTMPRMIESDEAPVQQFVKRFESHFAPTFQEAIRKCSCDHKKLRAFLNRGYDLDFSVSIDGYAADGNFEAIKILHERGLATASTDAMDRAAEKQDWRIVNYLHKHNLGGCTAGAMDAAAVSRNLQYVMFFNMHYRVGCTTVAMDAAASNGDIDIVRYLHEHMAAKCTTNAMDSAAEKGHFDIVEFLHTHRSEGCTTNAMDSAAEKGHFDIVEFLHTHRSEGCTADAVKLALAKGAKDVVAFLWTHYPHHFGADVLHSVLQYEHFEIFMGMRAQYPVEAEAVLSDVLFDAGKTYRLPTIRFIIEKLGGQDVAFRAMDGAASDWSSGRTQWIRAVFAVAGPTSCRLSAVKAFRTTYERHSSSSTDEATMFLVNACCEDGAREAMIGDDQDHDHIPMLLRGDILPPEVFPLHPFLTDPRASPWVIRWVLEYPLWHDPYRRLKVDWSWAVVAVQFDDVALLEILRDTPVSARHPYHIHGYKLHPSRVECLFTFEGARVAAVCRGNLRLLQWLIQHVDLPIEPTLLSDALFYHKYDIALWLAARCPEACRATNWNIPNVPSLTSCGLDQELLDWLEKHESVRTLLDFAVIIDDAASRGDVNSLRTMHKWHPDAVMAARPTLWS